MSSQVESSLQLTEQLPLQVIWQVAPSEQVTLLLSPTVSSQVEPPPQSTLHDAPQVPVHSLSAEQSRLQLACSQSLPCRPQASPAGHAQLVPLHSGGGTLSELPQPGASRNNASKVKAIFMGSHGTKSCTSAPAAHGPEASSPPPASVQGIR